MRYAQALPPRAHTCSVCTSDARDPFGLSKKQRAPPTRAPPTRAETCGGGLLTESSEVAEDTGSAFGGRPEAFGGAAAPRYASRRIAELVPVVGVARAGHASFAPWRALRVKQIALHWAQVWVLRQHTESQQIRSYIHIRTRVGGNVLLDPAGCQSRRLWATAESRRGQQTTEALRGV